MGLGDDLAAVVKKLASGRGLTDAEIERVRTPLNNVGQLLFLADMITQYGEFNITIAEFTGALTAQANINVNNNSATGIASGDSRINLQKDKVTLGALFFDRSLGNVVLQNLDSGKQIVFNTNDGNFIFFDDNLGVVVLTIGPTGRMTAPGLVSGTTQANAGAAADELWVDTDDNQTVKRGV